MECPCPSFSLGPAALGLLVFHELLGSVRSSPAAGLSLKMSQPECTLQIAQLVSPSVDFPFVSSKPSVWF